MARRDYLKDYQLSEEGTYEWQGSTWTWDSLDVRTTFIRSSKICVALAALCLVAIGFIPAGAIGNTALVLLPYALSVLALALTVVSYVRLVREGDPMRSYVYERSLVRLPAQTLFGLIVSVMAAVGEIITLVRGGTTHSALTILAVVLLLGVAASFLRMYKLVDEISLNFHEGQKTGESNVNAT